MLTLNLTIKNTKAMNLTCHCKQHIKLRYKKTSRKEQRLNSFHEDVYVYFLQSLDELSCGVCTAGRPSLIVFGTCVSSIFSCYSRWCIFPCEFIFCSNKWASFILWLFIFSLYFEPCKKDDTFKLPMTFTCFKIKENNWISCILSYFYYFLANKSFFFKQSIS